MSDVYDRVVDAINELSHRIADVDTEQLRLNRENKRLQAENAKLRELVRDMHRCFVRGHDWGPYCAGETVWVEQRMREL